MKSRIFKIIHNRYTFMAGYILVAVLTVFATTALAKYKMDVPVLKESITLNIATTKYTLTLDANGGSLSQGEENKTIGFNGTYGTLPTPTRTGYTFNGWYTAATDGNQVTADTVVEEGKDHTLYAHWTANTYIVRFNINDAGATGTMSDQQFTYDSPQTLSSLGFTKTHYKFVGWSKTPTGDIFCIDKQEVSNLASDQGAILNLYAIWMPDTNFVITYNTNGHDAFFNFPGNSTQAVAETRQVDESYTIKQQQELSLERSDGWIWVEWNTSPDGTGTRYLGGNVIDAVREDLTLYAIWGVATPATIGFADGENIADYVNNITGLAYTPGADKTSFTIQGRTGAGLDNFSVPIRELIPGYAYTLTARVTFNDFQFYNEDNHSYMFGTTILDTMDYYSILTLDGYKTTAVHENRMWSTESSGEYNFSMDFIATKDTMYWFWETTDIVDGEDIVYQFDNFSIQIHDKKVPARVEFENLQVTYNSTYVPSRAYTRWFTTDGTLRQFEQRDENNNLIVDANGNTVYTTNAPHKNYFHVEEYRFDYLRYRMWSLPGAERMQIPLTGLEVGKTYKLSFHQDLSQADTYNNGTQLFGSSVIEQYNFDDSNNNWLNYIPYASNGTWTDSRKYKYSGGVATDIADERDVTITFTATAETMYWQWLLNDIKDSYSPNWDDSTLTPDLCKYSWVELSNVTLTESN